MSYRQALNENFYSDKKSTFALKFTKQCNVILAGRVLSTPKPMILESALVGGRQKY